MSALASTEGAASGAVNPLVSVVVPVFNGERFLADALKSIRMQTYAPLELAVVDDGSTDGSGELAELFASGQDWCHVVHQENRGPGAARNSGIALARGSLITFLDADDEMSPDRIAFQVAYLRDHPDVDVVVGTQQIFVEDGTPTPSWVQRLPSPNQLPHYYPPSMMVRAFVFGLIGTFDATYRVGEDTEWMVRASHARASIAMVDHIVVRRRMHDANLTHQQGEMLRSFLRVVRKYLGRGSDDTNHPRGS